MSLNRLALPEEIGVERPLSLEQLGEPFGNQLIPPARCVLIQQRYESPALTC